jgi:hypothetical protein
MFLGPETSFRAFIPRLRRNGADRPLHRLFPHPEDRRQTIHSPKHCLPGAGWAFESSQYVDLTMRMANRTGWANTSLPTATARQFVIYWYQAHGRSVANEYMAKIYMVADAMRLNRTDGALVRVITPIDPREEETCRRQGAGRGICRAACAPAAALYPGLAHLKQHRGEHSARIQAALKPEKQPERMEDK